MDEERVTIGEAAELVGVSAKAIRLYESRGLLEPIERTANGYRTYGPDDLAVLRFVRQAKAVGLKLDEVGRIIDLQRSGQQPCATVIDLLDRRLGEVDRKLADLKAPAPHTGRRAQADEAERSGRDAVVCRVIESADCSPSRSRRTFPANGSVLPLPVDSSRGNGSQ